MTGPASAPRYVAIITDGNGRWAAERGLPAIEGHSAGADVVKARLRDAAEFGIRELTVFSFSTENWQRPAAEVDGLMRMFGERIDRETPELDAEGVRMRFIGRREGVADDLVERMEWAESVTATNERITLFVAFNYGGRAEIVDAARAFGGDSEADFRRHLYAAEMNDPDLLIRTSGEQRISNFLLWQCAYSELVFRDELWPDFGREAFEAALAEYDRRQRRFGGAVILERGDPRFDEDTQPFDAELDFERPRRRRPPPPPPLPAQPGPPREPRGPKRSRSETLARIAWALPWVAIVVTIVIVGGELFAAAMIGFACVGIAELFKMADDARPFALVAYAAVAALVVAALYGSQFQIVIVLAATIPAAFAAAVARPDREGATVSIAVTILGVVWIGIPFAHAVLLRELPDHGAALLVDVLVATFVADTAAYAGGRLFGRHRLAPALSPNKTLEGLAFGFVGGTMGFWFAGLYQDWLPGIDALVMGMCVAALAPVGDLFESLIKRDLRIKDSGTIFGPHGGLLDRLDAVMFTVVAGYYLAVAFVY